MIQKPLLTLSSGLREWRIGLLSLIFVQITLFSGAAIASTLEEQLTEEGAVGEVSMVLGKAYLLSPGSSRQRIQPGTTVRVNDQITTQASGHVHIRFIDEALVSIRPDSQLHIQRYDYNAENPALSTIKFNLVEGIARSISGKAAKAARDRYRMNTPIAAIGVRGTDFVVSASQNTVRALVNEGAIIVAPYSNDCLASALGPCALNAVELVEGARQIIELGTNQELPELLPLPDDRIPELMREQVAANSSDANADESGTDTTLYLESVTSKTLSDQVASTSLEPEPVSIVVPEFTPTLAFTQEQLGDEQLVWGRWAGGQGDRERITLSRNAAKSGRDITVGNDNYALYRTENGSKRIADGLGVVAFNLDSAQAFHHTANGITAMQVNGGELEIDFDLSRYSTELLLNGAAIGDITFSSAGRLFSGGYFHNRTETETLAGAVSLDGSQAGYLFEQILNAGAFNESIVEGLTLWGAGK